MIVRILTFNIRGLPWVRCPVEKIGAWIGEKQIPIVCFQEVFTASGRSKLKKILERHGYTVVIPRDDDVCLLPSGLLFAVLSTEFSIISDCFISFLHYRNVERFANKGFHSLLLRESAAPYRRIYVVNTHTQSDEEVLWITPKIVKDGIRKQQAAQIIAHFDKTPIPVLVVGDFNQESSLHPFLRTLHPPSALPIRKATFFRTGEDLDHIAWMPVQWTMAAAVGSSEGCSFCGTFGPQLIYCKVHEEAMSDHAAVEIHVQLSRSGYLHAESV
jgi:hypothetical protein